MSDPHTCPKCGYNLKADEIIVVDKWQLDPRGATLYENRYVNLTTQQHAILHSIAAEGGRYIHTGVLAVRHVDLLRSLDPNGSIKSQLNDIRKALRYFGIPIPFENARAIGYRWIV